VSVRRNAVYTGRGDPNDAESFKCKAEAVGVRR
jgi:hypothetical protein